MTKRTTPFLTVALLVSAALAGMPAAAQVEPAPLCLYAFSKDFCSASLSGGSWGLPICEFGTTGCNNLVGDDANFRGGITSSNGRCGEDPQNLVPCDEAPDFVGTLVATVDVRTQRHTPCKARGSWDGDFRILNSLGLPFAAGDLVATMGMGTHRPACQGSTCSKTCENCHDARRNDTDFSWRIGSEGTLKGRVQSGRYAGCSFTASFQGDFNANGDSRGPQVPNDAWKFCGTIEGVLECPCPQ